MANQATSANTRRNQIIARRVADKAVREVDVSRESDYQLWDRIESSLDRALNSAIYAGQSQKAEEMALAGKALIEVRLRGTQLKLDF